MDSSGTRYRLTSAQKYPAEELSFSADGRFFLALTRRSNKYYAQVWSVDTGSRVGIALTFSLESIAVALPPETNDGAGSVLGYECTEGFARMWNLDLTSGLHVGPVSPARECLYLEEPHQTRRITTTTDGHFAAIATPTIIYIYTTRPVLLLRALDVQIIRQSLKTAGFALHTFDASSAYFYHDILWFCLTQAQSRLFLNADRVMQPFCDVSLMNWDINNGGLGSLSFVSSLKPMPVGLLQGTIHSEPDGTNHRRFAVPTDEGLSVYDYVSGERISPILNRRWAQDAKFQFINSSFILGCKQEGGPYIWNVGRQDPVLKLDRRGGVHALDRAAMHQCYA